MMAFVPFVAAGAAASSNDDAVLARRVAEGDRLALDRLYRQHSAAVYRYAVAMCGNPAWAADATQEAFVGFALKPGGFDAARGGLAAYLIGAARHALWGQWRLQHNTVALPEADDEPTGEHHDHDAHAGPETQLVRAQTAEQVWHALRSLPWPQREAVVLVDLQDHSYDAAAQIAGIELNTLRTRVHRGRAKLARLLAQPDAKPCRTPATAFFGDTA
jgi:RNA polymerase sigma-70 factor, ECF subfamily